ncbi:hypothetical protein [Vibrio sp. PNB22_4_1]
MNATKMRQLFEKLKSPLAADFHVEQSDGTKGHLTLSVKNKTHGRNRMSVTFETQEKVIRERADFDVADNTVLLTNRLSQSLQEYCQENHINFIDSAGNMMLCKSNFYVCITGQKIEKIAPPKVEYLTIGMVKTVFALFAEKLLIQRTVRHIAEKAGVSIGMVQKTLEYLQHNEFMTGNRKRRLLINTDKLKMLWLQCFLIHIASKRNKTVFEEVENLTSPYNDSQTLLSGPLAASKQLCWDTSDQTAVLYSRNSLDFSDSHKKQENTSNFRRNVKHTVHLVEPFWGERLQVSFEARKLLILADLSDSTCNQNSELTQQFKAQIFADTSTDFG